VGQKVANKNVSVPQDWGTQSQVAASDLPKQDAKSDMTFMILPGVSSTKVCAPGCATCQIHAEVQLRPVFGSDLITWQTLVRLKPTKSLGAWHIEATASIGRDPDKMSESPPSACRSHDTDRVSGGGEGEQADKITLSRIRT
jgi:hypothetical protein